MMTILKTSGKINGTTYNISLTRDGGEVIVTINGEQGVWDHEPNRMPSGCIVGMEAAWDPNDGGETERIYDMLDAEISCALRAL